MEPRLKRQPYLFALQHVRRDAARRAGVPATADPCSFSHSGVVVKHCLLANKTRARTEIFQPPPLKSGPHQITVGL